MGYFDSLRHAVILPFWLAACSSSSADSLPNLGGGGASGVALGSGAAGARATGDKGAGQGQTPNVGTAGGAGLAASPSSASWNSAKSATLSDDRLTDEFVSWKSGHVESCSDGSAIVVKDGAVASEGIGYGMLIAASLGDQPLFDGLWKYYQAHLDKNGLMNRYTARCEAPGNKDSLASESDADLDAAMALVQAAEHWPRGTYLEDAEALAGKIAEFEVDMCNGRRILRPSDAFGGCSDASDQRINPSYFAPGYYKVFAHYFREQAATWSALADGSYQLFALYQSRMNNLLPDWSGPDGSDNGSTFAEQACRAPWRVAVDYGWSGDTRAKTFMQNVSTWVDGNGGLPKAAPAPSSAFIGSFALAGGYEQGKFDDYVESWLAAHTDDSGYYPGTLRVLYMLAAAGKFSSTL